MQQQVQLARSSSEITLRGSVELVAEFFGFAINSILYQRGVYPADTFVSVAKYGLSTQVTADEGLKTYLASVVRQLAGWLAVGAVKKLVVVIAGAEASAGGGGCRQRGAGTAVRRKRAPPAVNFPAALPTPRPQTRETLERWVFHVETDKSALAPGCVPRRFPRVRARARRAAAAPPPRATPPACAAAPRRASSPPRRSRARSRRSSARSRPR